MATKSWRWSQYLREWRTSVFRPTAHWQRRVPGNLLGCVCVSGFSHHILLSQELVLGWHLNINNVNHMDIVYQGQFGRVVCFVDVFTYNELTQLDLGCHLTWYEINMVSTMSIIWTLLFGFFSGRLYVLWMYLYTKPENSLGLVYISQLVTS